MFSVPAQTVMLASPTCMAMAPWIRVSNPDPQRLGEMTVDGVVVVYGGGAGKNGETGYVSRSNSGSFCGELFLVGTYRLIVRAGASCGTFDYCFLAYERTILS